MKKFILYIMVTLWMISCSDQPVESKEDTVNDSPSEEVLRDTASRQVSEWYQGKEQIKMRGQIDENKQRHGKWVYYSQTGLELSMTTYTHGSKEGFSVVKYPNGAMHYRGEYRDDKKVGLWSFYNDKGELDKEVNYDNE
jgi:antitoxin component YwqK of YwqJK toxin-antitoxin module